MFVFGSMWICLWGKPTTGACQKPSKKGSFVSWAVTISSVDSCNHNWVRNCWVLRNHLPLLISCWRAGGALAVSVHYFQVWAFRQAGPRQVGFVINQSILVWGEQPLLHIWVFTHVKASQLSCAGFLQFLKCWWLGRLLWSQLALNAEHKGWGQCSVIWKGAAVASVGGVRFNIFPVHCRCSRRRHSRSPQRTSNLQSFSIQLPGKSFHILTAHSEIKLL